MQDRNKTAAPAAAAGQAAGSAPAVKERVFSIVKKAMTDGITDGKRMLWIDFTPHVVVERREDGYVAWLWRDCVVVKIFLDHSFNIVGFDVEGP
jgi:hypothetical protein